MTRSEIPDIITREWLEAHPDVIFVFGDNTLGKGTAGAAALRYVPNTFGFITKRYPTNKGDAFYHPDEYVEIYRDQVDRLITAIAMYEEKTFVISPIGSGLANRYGIWEQVILPRLKADLTRCLGSAISRVIFLF